MKKQERREKEMKKRPKSGCGGRSFMPFEVVVLRVHFHIG